MASLLRLGLFFAALFVGSGASLPFIPVWFRAQGLSATQMAVILASPYFGRTVFGPLLALWADLFRLRRHQRHGRAWPMRPWASRTASGAGLRPG